MVTVCEKARPSFQPRKPASIAPTRGVNAATHERVIKSMFLLLPLEGVQVCDIDRLQVAEERHEYRQPDRGFRRGDREDEEHEHLPREVAEVVREGDEVHVDGEQHQLDRHQQDDEVLAVEEDSHDANGKQARAEDEVVAQGDHGVSPRVADVSSIIFTMRRRSAERVVSWVRESCDLVSLRLLRVIAIAATMATSRITAAISKGNT